MMDKEINSYKDLTVWRKSMDLVKQVYLFTKSFPKEEQFGLTSQMRRAAVAIPSNIAEGYRRKHLKEYIQFLSIANGSASELETQLNIVNEVMNINESDGKKVENLLQEVLKMLNVMISKLENKS